MKKKKSDIELIKTTYMVNDAIANRIGHLYSHSAPLIICEALLFIVGGILMLIRPILMMSALTAMVGIGLFLFGMYRTIVGFLISRSIAGGWFDVMFGMINIIFGVIFCIYPYGSLRGMIYIFVALFLFNAIRILFFSINMMRAKFGHYILNFVVSLILILLTGLLLRYPSAVTIIVAYCLSAMMLLYGMADIYIYSEYAKLRREYT
ncbi:MAG: DUF308 domain-containing protein [Alphaproteobacteria bacterium]|nr:DUF308 domain-containing protein [Alphaproteobacteria bacterium]